MTITRMGLTNFRGFNHAEIDLAPLTVLIGPNSSGKSSFTQAIAALAHGTRGQNKVDPSIRPAISDDETWPVDLGPPELLRRDGSSGPIGISLLTSEGWVEYGFGRPGDQSLKLSSLKWPSPTLSVTVPISRHREASPALPPEAPPQGVTTSAPTDVLEFVWRDGVWVDRAHVPSQVSFSGAVLQSYAHGTETAGTGSPVARREVEAFLRHFRYLRALRFRPRHAYPPYSEDDIGYDGAGTPSYLENHRGDLVEVALPPPVPTRVDEAIGMLNAPWVPLQQRDKGDSTLGRAIDFWMHKLGISCGVESGRSGHNVLLNAVVEPDGKPRPLTGVGLGLTQVLPVLIGGLITPKDATFAVDLPEAHLHPRPQAALADFFCSLVKSGRRAIVETHSDTFFHRLRVRASMDAELAASIRVYLFEGSTRTEACAAPILMPLTGDAETKWPPQFLMEATEAEVSVRAIRGALRRLNQK